MIENRKKLTNYFCKLFSVFRSNLQLKMPRKRLAGTSRHKTIDISALLENDDSDCESDIEDLVDAEAADAGWIDNEASVEEDTEVVEYVDTEVVEDVDIMEKGGTY